MIKCILMNEVNLKNVFLGAGILAVTFFLLFFVWKFSSKSKTPEKVNIQIKKEDHMKGNASSKVALVEYSDFQCPACGAYYPIVKEVNKKYKDKIRFVYRHFPLDQHKNAFLAAETAEAAALQDKFWEMHDKLFENQDTWSEKNNAQDIFIGYAKSLKLDVDKFKKDLKSEPVKNKVIDNQQSGLSYGVNSTPTFYLNGVKLDSPRSLEDFEKLINEASL